MSDPTWLKPDISLSVFPPVVGSARNRSAAELDAILDQFQVETAQRYRVRSLEQVVSEYEDREMAAGALKQLTPEQRRSKQTFCNVFCSDVTAALGAPIPHRLEGKWQDVRANCAWLLSQENNWKRSSAGVAQREADLGRPAVVVLDPMERKHGHIAVLTPSRGQKGTWICQAGARCYRRAPLAAGFGAHTNLIFFTHD